MTNLTSWKLNNSKIKIAGEMGSKMNILLIVIAVDITVVYEAIHTLLHESIKSSKNNNNRKYCNNKITINTLTIPNTDMEYFYFCYCLHY